MAARDTKNPGTIGGFNLSLLTLVSQQCVASGAESRAKYRRCPIEIRAEVEVEICIERAHEETVDSL